MESIENGFAWLFLSHINNAFMFGLNIAFSNKHNSFNAAKAPALQFYV